MLHLHVYHGCINHDNKRDDVVFFSSEKSFSEDYGDVQPYELTLSFPFNSSSREDIELLLKVVPELVDPFSGETFYSYYELLETGLLYHDTWEIFEPLIKQVESLGFDGMIIYEGGVENFVSFDYRQYKVLAS